MRKKRHVHAREGWSGSEEVCTHPTADKGQTDDRENIVDGLSDGHGDVTDGDQTNGCRCSALE